VNDPGTSYTINKTDALISDMDNGGINQLIAVYTAVQDGKAFVVTETDATITIDWS
jgi:hypothetical protein